MLHSLYVMYMIIMIIFFGAARTYADVVASRSPTLTRVERNIQIQPELQSSTSSQCERSTPTSATQSIGMTTVQSTPGNNIIVV